MKMKPRAKRKDVIATAIHVWGRTYPEAPLPSMFVCGIRGYYRDTMGVKGRNDRGIYDDAIFVVGPETFAAFNANTDPSRHRPGIASLISGVHPYRPGNHGISKPDGGYPAFRPNTKGEALPVMRDGMESPAQGIAINIHRGSRNSTSSLGCQTIPPDQWDAFYTVTRSEMKKAGQKTFSYVLCDGPII